MNKMKRYLHIFLFFLFFISSVNSGYSQYVIINEVCASPAPGPNGNSINANSLYNMDATCWPPENREWVELYNPNPCNSIDISCYTLASNMLQTYPDNAPNWGALTFPAGTVIPPLGFIVVGGNNSTVPVLDFSITDYRNNFYGIQYLDGEYTRWFLRDEFGWIAIYDPSGSPVDAVYWDAYGDSTNLLTKSEYSQNVYTSTACSGTQNLAAARNIAGIKYVGVSSPGTNVSFQRSYDGSRTWFTGPVVPTPRACNSTCVGPPLLSATIQDASCANNGGEITITIQDGHTGPYTINWIQPAGLHTSTVGNLSSGTYIVQVVDAYNCFIVYDTFNLGMLPSPTITFSASDETCNAANGSIQAIVSNGNPPITYQWSVHGSGNVQTVHNLPAGTYYVTITDNLGCTASDSITLINYPGPVISIDSVHNEMCTGSDGAIFTKVTGGSSPFSYAWNSTPQQFSADLTCVHAGNYIVTVTDTRNCSATASALITDTPLPTISFSSVRADTCHKQTGSVSILAGGGHPPYSYQWSIGSNNTSFLDHLPQGTYSVSVTDSFCTNTATFTIPYVPGPVADFTFYPPVATLDHPTIRFEDMSAGYIDHWNWDFGDLPYSSDRIVYHSYSDTGIFSVTLTVGNNSGCIDSITKEVIIIDRITLYVPSCFTPNGDNRNDYFFVAGQNITDFEFYLYNRWGELIYKSYSMNDKWDGKYKGEIVPEGVYTWVINYAEDYAGMYKLPKGIKGVLTVVR